MEHDELIVIKERFLKDCSSDEVFWIRNGVIIRNVYELIEAIENMDEWTFRYHVNQDNNKNDFADWIRDVFSYDDLAVNLEGVIDKKKYIRILKKELKKLEKLV